MSDEMKEPREIIFEEPEPEEEIPCSKCGKILANSEIEDDFRFNKGPVCYGCFLKFLYKKRILGEFVLGILAFIVIVMFYLKLIVFGLFFIALLVLIYLDWRSVNNYIIEIETKIKNLESVPQDQSEK
ncbi:MAG: hypothetical protein PHV06_05565 [bacterium]|nr:hypothetical protein [bacterium]